MSFTDSVVSLLAAQVVCVPGWVTRGAGARTHHEYEVRVRLPGAAWALLRRYRRFRDLYLAARALYGEKVGSQFVYFFNIWVKFMKVLAPSHLFDLQYFK